ncbi:FMN-dependent NADH-azoreductase [Vibrio harveyi]|uniref:FMN-dependent NADH-azoreductase n=1 Tax=Vibrio harveyi TaxID=669 RepID=UPI000C7BDD96|nr:NAD(P)H-dependent oxidoreductase [Vibrio harveyi]EKO3848622.1 NAD(P)H-dependent oxidoreductase [Vibrio harveyi]
MNILSIQSSILGDQSISRMLVDYAVSHIESQLKESHIDTLDLAKETMPHIDESYFNATILDEKYRSDTQRKLIAHSDELISRFKAADIIVIGAPLYNATIPTKLASTFDYIARAGVTFKYTEKGVEGLLGDRQVIIISSRGGFHKDTPLETQTHHLSNFFKELGIKSIKFIYAEGTGISEEVREKSVNRAKEDILNILEF